MNGSDVKFVQEKLISLGLLPEGENDGWYGPKSMEAVQKYQMFFGLESDGVAGPKTIKSMLNYDKNREFDQDLKKVADVFSKSEELYQAKHNEESGLFFQFQEYDWGQASDSFLNMRLDNLEFQKTTKSKNIDSEYCQIILKNCCSCEVPVTVQRIVGDGSGYQHCLFKTSDASQILISQYWHISGYEKPQVYCLKEKKIYSMEEGIPALMDEKEADKILETMEIMSVF